MLEILGYQQKEVKEIPTIEIEPKSKRKSVSLA
jgi:hypothetical protein